MRRLFTLASALSLLLFMAVVGLWVRSYWVSENVAWNHRGTIVGVDRMETEIDLSTGRGGLSFVLFRSRNDPADNSDIKAFYYLRYTKNFYGGEGRTARSMWNRLGFFAGTESESFPLMGVRAQTDWWVTFPFWTLAVAAVLLPSLVAMKLLRLLRNQPERGCRCRRCGYDLRGTPNRCPECGTVPKTSKIA